MDIEFLRYCRAKSTGFGHSTRKRDVEKAWAEIHDFLEEHTIYEFKINPQIELWKTTDEIQAELLSLITETYGETDTTKGTPYRWLLEKEFDQRAIDLAFKNKNYPKHQMGPIEVHLPFSFYWKNIDRSILSKYQHAFDYFSHGYNGKFSVHLGQKAFIQPEFIIPFIPESKESDEMVDELEIALPFKLNRKDLTWFKPKTLKNGQIRYMAHKKT